MAVSDISQAVAYLTDDAALLLKYPDSEVSRDLYTGSWLHLERVRNGA